MPAGESVPAAFADYHVVMPKPAVHHGLTLLETVLSVTLIALLFSILLPALNSARTGSYRDRCQFNQHMIGQAWQNYLIDHNLEFPTVPVQPGWFYGGMRFSPVSDTMIPDSNRPLTSYLGLSRTRDPNEVVCSCPADHGVTDADVSVGTGRRTALRSYGTSYRANHALLWWQSTESGELNGSGEGRGLNRQEITTAPSRLLLLGDPVWYEVAESTGRNADWHGEPNSGNLLFLDGSVRFVSVKPRHVVGPVVLDPMMRGSVAPTIAEPGTTQP